jgi:hypothetical protein
MSSGLAGAHSLDRGCFVPGNNVGGWPHSQHLAHCNSESLDRVRVCGLVAVGRQVLHGPPPLRGEAYLRRRIRCRLVNMGLSVKLGRLSGA